jgi:hypothetical protein
VNPEDFIALTGGTTPDDLTRIAAELGIPLEELIGRINPTDGA